MVVEAMGVAVGAGPEGRKRIAHGEPAVGWGLA